MKLFGGAAKFASFTTSKNVQYTPVANGTKFGQSGVAYVKAADRIWNWDLIADSQYELSYDHQDEETDQSIYTYSNSSANSLTDILYETANIPPMHKVMIFNGDSIIWGKLVVRPTDPSNSECDSPLSAYVQYKLGNETVESIIRSHADDYHDDYITINDNDRMILVFKKSNTQFTATKSEYTLAQVREDSELYSGKYFVPEEYAGMIKFDSSDAYFSGVHSYTYQLSRYSLLQVCDPTKTVYLLNNN